MKAMVTSALARAAAGMLGASAAVLGSRQLFPSDRPAWVGGCLFLAVAGAGSGILLLRRRWLRKNDHRTGGIEVVAETPINAGHGQATLRSQWKTAITFLKRSALRKRGNPRYVLPWYLVLGASGSGKTSALQDAGVATFAGATLRAEPVATSHCGWSFFEQAIVIDTAGRYAFWADQNKDKAEWHELLDLLFTQRRKEPLNGLIVTVAADHLMTSGDESLRSEGQTLRQRIDELMRMVGSRIPVYVLVTKSDALDGVKALGDHLSPQGLSQAMGCLNEEGTTDASAFLDKAFSTVSDRLKRLRLVLTRVGQPGAASPALLRVTDQLLKVRVGAAAFIQGAFQENLYQETPLLRGLFLTSAGRGSNGSNAPRGWFLHDLFARILPADRALFSPTRRALGWRRNQLGIGMACWLSFALAASGLMSYSFIRNLRLLKDTDQQFARLAGRPSDQVGAILALDQLDQAVILLQEKSRSGWISAFGLRDVARVQQALEEKLSVEFRRRILLPIDTENLADLAALTASSSDDHYARWIGHLVGRLSVLRAKVDGASRTSLQQIAPPPIPFLKLDGRDASTDLKEMFGRLYVHAVAWSSDEAGVDQELSTLQAQLQHLLKLKAGNPRWVIAWAAAQNSVPPITLGEFWGGQTASPREPVIPGLFSQKGKTKIDAFFREIDRALADPAASFSLKAQFERWYRARAYEAWHQFLNSFNLGWQRLRGQDQWQQAVSRMAGEQGPYNAFLIQMAREFDPVAIADLPPWLQHIEKARDLSHSVAYWNYRQQLEKAAKAAADPAKVLTETAQAFNEQSEPGTSLFSLASGSLARLKAAAPKEVAGDPAVWRLVSGPLDFLWQYARLASASHLQADWDNQVLAAATGLSGTQALSVLLAKEGPAIRFAKEQAAPFVEWKPQAGYFAKQRLGGALPFSGAFFAFLNGAVWVSSVSELHVAITTQDPETNPGSARIPHVTRLTINCGGKPQVLASRRWRVIEKSFNVAQQQFSWSPACGDTLLEMTVGGARLKKTYPGSYGFLAFLHDFKTGKHTFYRNDFPDQIPALAPLGITWIAMHYRIQGAPDFAAPTAAPSKILSSWEPR